jgi:leucyl-tRNA synthetase
MADTLPGAKEAPKSFARRDHLRSIEATVQAEWEAAREFDADAPAPGEPSPPKFMVTFPYPYMNGRLHLGHAFTVSKAEFAAGYARLRGKRVLFPFAFHCTGMPIQAAANKLAREAEAGSTPEAVAAAIAARAAGGGDEAGGDDAADADDAAAPAPAPAAEPAPAGAEDGGAGGAAAAAGGAPPAAAGGAGDDTVKELGKYSGKKSKAVAKGAAGVTVTQTEIMLKSGIAPADIPPFRDPRHWLKYFPPLGEADLRGFGLHTDWRRSFITTDANPYYDSFIRWQFNALRRKDKIGFGKRPTIYSPLDGQACADHDRASGEGVAPQEYTLIKIRLQAVPPAHRAADRLAPLAAVLAAGRPVFFVAATLRPETMYGQTNCYLLPEGEYGAFEIAAGGDVFICAERAAKNMSYQGLSPARGAPSCLGTFTGADLLGLPLSAPYAAYPTVYTLPLMTISMKKGTGVVTSVPSDAPDDWAALRDLKDKPKLREKFGITDDMVAHDVVEIIDIPVTVKVGNVEGVALGRRAALTVCDVLKIGSQNDRDKLKEAKDAVYMAGFYQGIMLVGKYAGRKVADAKPLVRADMIAEGLAVPYWEPESTVVSRSGDECVVADIDQWFLKYGEPAWRGVVESWLKRGFNAHSEHARAAFEHVVSWLREWACSRSFGLGTRLPWDAQFVIESLSDSTIYMAYYTVAHLLHGGSLDGTTRGPLGIAPEALTDAAWEYVFGDDGVAPPAAGDPAAAIPLPALDAMRREFRYWYPMDLRVSGKDLIGNHLTMSLYNHAAIWEGPADADTGAPTPRADRMPQAFFTNGHVLVDGEKMSKSRGNFIMMHEAVARWSADGTRFALADAGDTMDDANFERDKADNAILRLTTDEEFMRDTLEAVAAGKLRKGAPAPPVGAPAADVAAAVAALEADPSLLYADKVVLSKINANIAAAAAAYEDVKFRDALLYAFYEMQLARDGYRDMCGKLGVPLHEGVIRRWMDVQAVVMAPITPHWCEHVWKNILGHGAAGSVTRAAWPAAGAVNSTLLQADAYLSAKLHEFRLAIAKVSNVKPAKAAKGVVAQPKPTDANIFVAAAWPEWQRRPLAALSAMWSPAAHGDKNCGFPDDALTRVKDLASADPELRPFMKKIMPLASATISDMKGRTTPTATLAMSLPFDEFAMWTDNAEYVRKALDLPGGVAVFLVSDPALAAGSPSAKELDPLARAKDVVPMDAAMHPFAKSA